MPDTPKIFSFGLLRYRGTRLDMWKLFLDDERDLSHIGEEGHLEWRVARSVEEAKSLILKWGMPVEMSLGDDLDDKLDLGYTSSTSMEFLRWLQQWWKENGKPPVPVFQTHSVSPVGVQNIRNFMRSWLRLEKMEQEKKEE